MVSQEEVKNSYSVTKILLGSLFLTWVITTIAASISGSESWVFIPLAGFNFLVHELGHDIGSLSGARLLEAISGTFFEIVVVVGLCLWLVGRKEAIATLFASAWIIFTFVGIGRYMADAEEQQLSLYSIGSITGNSDVYTIHDWHVIFSDFNLKEESDRIGQATAIIGIVFGVPLLISGTKQLSNSLLEKRAKES